MKLTLLFLVLAFAGCAELDNYDRSDSLQDGDAKGTISADVTLHPRGPTNEPAASLDSP